MTDICYKWWETGLWWLHSWNIFWCILNLFFIISRERIRALFTGVIFYGLKGVTLYRWDITVHVWLYFHGFPVCIRLWKTAPAPPTTSAPHDRNIMATTARFCSSGSLLLLRMEWSVGEEILLQRPKTVWYRIIKQNHTSDWMCRQLQRFLIIIQSILVERSCGMAEMVEVSQNRKEPVLQLGKLNLRWSCDMSTNQELLLNSWQPSRSFPWAFPLS